jgi:hypothetical protein
MPAEGFNLFLKLLDEKYLRPPAQTKWRRLSDELRPQLQEGRYSKLYEGESLRRCLRTAIDWLQRLR